MAVIRGSAVNQDGRSTVLTAPNGKAQKAMIREALETAAAVARADLVSSRRTAPALPSAIPSRWRRFADTLGRDEAGGAPCFVGSAKANIGHLEAAAGVVGLIKAALVLRHQMCRRSRASVCSARTSRSTGHGCSVPTVPMPLAGADAPKCAAVSSFGIGGTNAHVVVEEAPDLAVIGSHRKAQSGRCRSRPKRPRDWRRSAMPGSTCWMMHTARRSRISAYRRRGGGPLPGAHRRRREGAGCASRAAWPRRWRKTYATAVRPPRLGFVFSGQGPQWWAMGRELQQTETAFRAAMQACDAAILPFAGWSVIDELAKPEDQSRMAETAIAQPALFAMQTSLAALWASWGMRPAALTATAWARSRHCMLRGILSLSEAARVVVKRGLDHAGRDGQGTDGCRLAVAGRCAARR